MWEMLYLKKGHDLHHRLVPVGEAAAAEGRRPGSRLEDIGGHPGGKGQQRNTGETTDFR